MSFVYLWPPMRFAPMKRSLFLLSALSLFGCSTELEVNAPYKDITVVYGLLNQRDTIQYIKINKAFLGEGDAYQYAMIRDSNEYTNEQISHKQIHRLNASGARVETFELRDTTVTNRLPGDFYSPEQTVYYFKDGAQPVTGDTFDVFLEQGSEYELDLVVKGKQISSRTTVVNNFSISSVNSSPTTEVTLFTSNGFQNYLFKWTSGRYGKRYEASWRFNYSEVDANGDTTEHSITQKFASRVASNSGTPGQEFEAQIEGEGFFNTIANQVPVKPNVHRIIRGIDLIVDVANDEFHTALALNEPISGIVEERPAYSNVENGLGIFGSRYSKAVIGKQLTTITMNEMITGSLANRNFCYFVGENLLCD